MVRFLWTRHAHEKIHQMGFSQDRVETALSYGTAVSEGRNKFKILCRIKGVLLIAVCREDESGIWIVTVIRKRG